MDQSKNRVRWCVTSSSSFFSVQILIDSCCKQNFVVGEGEIKSPPERKLLPVLEVPVPETHQAYKYHIILCKGVVVQYSKDP